MRIRFAGGPLVSVLALLHGYVGLRLLAPAPPAMRWAAVPLLAGLFALLMASAASGFGRRGSRRAIWAGLLAMGFFSNLLLATLLRDALLAFFFVVHRLGDRPGLDAAWLAASAAAVPALAVAASAIGFRNARRRPPVRQIDVPINNLPAALDGFSIVQLSDLHVGPTIRKPFVEGVVETANALDADLIAITGDVVDGGVAELRPHVAPLAGLRARHGVFAVTGNHEYYAGAAEWVTEFRRLGWRMLMDEHVVIEVGAAAIIVAGIVDASARHFDSSHASDPATALRGAPARAFKLLLAHQPRSAGAAAAAGADLQLSGHTHGGQFVPWPLFVPLQQPWIAGLHRLGRLQVYVSRGTGYWGPPIRLGAPSEITRLRLVRSGR